MTAQQWILFGTGWVFMIVGAGLMAYGALQRGARAGEEAAKESAAAQILKAVSGLVAELGKYLGPSRASRVGLLLLLAGLFLMFAPFYVPGLKR